MAAICPKCRQRLELEQIPLRKFIRMVCSSCRSPVKVELVVTLEPLQQESTTSRRFNPAKVVTAVEGDASNEMIWEVLGASGFEVVAAPDPQDLLNVLVQEGASTVVLDVGLPHGLGFQIPNQIRNREDIKDTVIILLASIHDTAKYKREPDSLYGADDYIERHHIHDELLPKIKAILEKRSPPVTVASSAPAKTETPRPSAAALEDFPHAKSTGQAMSIEHVFEDILEDERNTAAEKNAARELKKSSGAGPIATDPAAHEAAKRLARIIVSDIALYNQRRVEEGIRQENLLDLLKEEFDEGLQLYKSRVPADVRSDTHYFEEAIQNFIRKRKGNR